jgi:integrase
MAEDTERDILGLIRSTKGNLNLNKFKKKKPTKFNVAVETWITLSTCSIEWIRARERIANKYLIPFFGTMNLEDIEEGHLQQFHAELKQKGLGEKYIYNIFGELKALFHRNRRSIPFLPDFPQIKFQDPVIRYLTSKQQDEVFESIPEIDRPIFTFMRYTGCRPNEARGLLRDNVFLRADPPYLVLSTVLGGNGQLKQNTKTRKVKPLPIIPEIEMAIKPKEVTRFIFTKRGRPYSKKMVGKIWNKANLEANQKYGTPIVHLYQGTKHSFGCQRLNAGFSLDEIAAVMGHTDKRTTLKYAKYQVSKLGDVMRGK